MGLFGNDSTVQTTFVGKDQLSPVARGVRSTMDRLKRDAKTGFGLAAGFGVMGLVTTAIGGVVDVLGDMGKAASDMNETQTKLDAVFKTSADLIRGWATTSTTAMGQSEQAALEAAGTFGNFLQAMGAAEPEAARMSMALVQLAGDLGSFNNQDPTDVLLALRSGMSGEIEPMRKFGADLSAATVEAYLMSQGIEKVGKGFTQAQKIQGRYALIMKQTTTAQGDFARTADGTANSQRILTAKIEDAKAKLGGFVNEITNTATHLSIDLIGALGDASRAIHDFLDPTQADVANVNARLRQMADEWGLSAQSVVDFADAQRKSAEAADRAAASQELVNIQVEAYRVSLMTGLGPILVDVNEKVAEFRKLLEDEARATEKAAQAQEYSNSVIGKASAIFAQFQRDAAFHAALAALGIGEAMHKIGEAATDAAGGVRELTDEEKAAAAEAASLRAKFKSAIDTIAGITKGSLAAAKEEAKAGMADLMWAFKHPLEGKKLENFYKKMIEAGNRAMHRAQRGGYELALAKATKFVEDYKGRLAELRGADLTINTSVHWPQDTRRYAPEPGRRGQRGPATSGYRIQSRLGDRSPRMGEPHGHDIILDGERVGHLLDRRNGRLLAAYGPSSRP